MQAVFIEKPGGRLVVKETLIPDPGPGDVLIKITAAPINPSDIARIENVYGETDMKNFIPGIEGSGTVIAAGKGLLPRLWLGKRVACSSGYSTSGTWAEYMVTPAVMCFPLSSKVSDEQGSMTLVNPLTALAFFEIVSRDRHKAIINNAAASALGRMLELLGKKNNVPVINIVRSKKQAEMLKLNGSAFVLNSTDTSFITDLGILSKKLKATVFFDTVCNSDLPGIAEVLPENSAVIIYGNRSGEERIMFNPRSLIDKKIKISGFYLGSYTKENGIFKNMMNLMKVRHLMSTDLRIKIREKLPLNMVQEAVDKYLENMSEGKILLIPGLHIT